MFRIFFILILLGIAIRALLRVFKGVSERWTDVQDTQESLSRRKRKLDIDESKIEDADFKEVRDRNQQE